MSGQIEEFQKTSPPGTIEEKKQQDFLFERCKSAAAYDARTGKFICPDTQGLLTKTPIKINENDESSFNQNKDQESQINTTRLKIGFKTKFFFHSPQSQQNATTTNTTSTNDCQSQSIIYQSVYSQETLLSVDSEEPLLNQTKKPEDTSEENKTDSLMLKEDASPAQTQTSQQSQMKQDTEKGDADVKDEETPFKQLNYFADTWSILRFVKGNKSQGVDISPDGLTISLAPSHKGGQIQQELVLTNMAFSSGVHFWEINTTLSPDNIQFGAYEPVSKIARMTQLKSKVPRIVTICLDLPSNCIKFWLNGRKLPKYTICLDLTDQQKEEGIKLGGAWVPCVHLRGEKTSVSLNPFAREPSQFYEFYRERHNQIETFYMPLLQNSILVANLPPMGDHQTSHHETAKALNQIFQQSSSYISQIHMPQRSSIQETSNSETGSLAEIQSTFCYIKFHHYSFMVEFLKKHAQQFEIYGAPEILDWFKAQNGSLAQDYQRYFNLVRTSLQMPKACPCATKIALDKTNVLLIKLSEEETKTNQSQREDYPLQRALSGQISENKSLEDLQVIEHSFTDKILISRSSTGQVKSVSRSLQDGQFHLNQVDFSSEPTSHLSLVNLNINVPLLLKLLQIIDLNELLNTENCAQSPSKQANHMNLNQAQHLILGSLETFFSHVSDQRFWLEQAGPTGVVNKVQVPIYAAKLSIDFLMSKVRKMQKLMEEAFDRVSIGEFQEDSVAHKKVISEQKEKADDKFRANVDDLDQLFAFLTDIQEQFWAKTRSDQCPPELKLIFSNVSRPYSALNRLGSFIQWPHSSQSHLFQTSKTILSAFKMAENGLFLKTEQSLGLYGNSMLHISSPIQSLNLFGSTRQKAELLGSQSKILSGLSQRNIQMSDSLNYLHAQRFASVTEVIPSVNSPFVLVGGKYGCISICSSRLASTPLRFMQFFTNSVEKRYQKVGVIFQRLKSRYQSFIKYQEYVSKKDGLVPELFTKQQMMKKISQKEIKSKQTAIKQTKKSQQIKDQMPADSAKEKEQSQLEDEPEKITVNIQTANEVQEQEPLDQKEVPAEAKAIDLRSSSLLKASQQKRGNDDMVRMDVSQTKVLGFILLSEHKPSIAPLLIGCVYRNNTNGKFYLRVRKMMHDILLLSKFVLNVRESGNQVNLLGNTQQRAKEFTLDQLNELIEHQETLLDIYPLFMRNQAFKKNFPRHESKFPVLTEVDESELELTGVTQIIDFTSTVLSIEKQDSIHILAKNEAGDSELRQIRIETDFKKCNNPYIGKIDLVQTVIHSLDPNQSLLRVFQVENEICILEPSKISIYCQERLTKSREIALKAEFLQDMKSSRKACGVNQTSTDQIFNESNIESFGEEIPKQAWSLCLQSSESKKLVTIPIVDQTSTDETKREIEDTLTEIQVANIIRMAKPYDLRKSLTLLQTKNLGFLVSKIPLQFKCQQTLLTKDGQSFTRANIQKIAYKQDKLKLDTSEINEFNFSINQSIGFQKHKKILLEVSFTLNEKESIFDTKLNKLNAIIEKTDSEWANYDGSVKQLPMTVEKVHGCNNWSTKSFETQPTQVLFADQKVARFTRPGDLGQLIFRHQESMLFIPTCFSIWSKTTSDTGRACPIGQGLIFASNSLSDLLDFQAATQFQAMTKEKFGEWQAWRSQNLLLEPLKAHEPIAFFDFGDKEKIEVNLNVRMAYKYIKLMPLAFRREPINYVDIKEFEEHNAELMYFGVSGYQVDPLLIELPSVQTKNLTRYPELKVPFEMDVYENSKDRDQSVTNDIASTKYAQIEGFRNTSSIISMQTPANLLNTNFKAKQKLVGISKFEIILQESQQDLHSLAIKIKSNRDKMWQFSGLSFQVQAYKNSSEINFASSDFNRLKTYIQKDLFSIGESEQNTFIESMISLINRDILRSDNDTEKSADCIYTEAVKTLCKLIVDPNLLQVTQRISLIEKVQKGINIDKILQAENFITQWSIEYQKFIFKLIEIAGLRRIQKARDAVNRILDTLFLKLDHSVLNLDQSSNQMTLIPFDVIKNCLNMVPRKRTPQIAKKLIKILQDDIPKVAQSQSQYQNLRAYHQTNAFPFDIDYAAIKSLNFDKIQESSTNSALQYQNSKYISGNYSILPQEFKVSKIGPSYLLKVDLGVESIVKGVKLIFSFEKKAFHRFSVSLVQQIPFVLDHSNANKISYKSNILYTELFDESVFNLASKKSHQELDLKINENTSGGQMSTISKKLDNLGQIQPSYGENIQNSKLQSREQSYTTSLQALTLNLDDQIEFSGRFFFIQIELLDTVLKPTKNVQISSVLITPEFYGEQIDQRSQSQQIQNDPDILNLNLENFASINSPDKSKKSLFSDSEFLCSFQKRDKLQQTNCLERSGVFYNVYDLPSSNDPNQQNDKLLRMISPHENLIQEQTRETKSPKKLKVKEEPTLAPKKKKGKKAAKKSKKGLSQGGTFGFGSFPNQPPPQAPPSLTATNSVYNFPLFEPSTFPPAQLSNIGQNPFDMNLPPAALNQDTPKSPKKEVEKKDLTQLGVYKAKAKSWEKSLDKICSQLKQDQAPAEITKSNFDEANNLISIDKKTENENQLSKLISNAHQAKLELRKAKILLEQSKNEKDIASMEQFDQEFRHQLKEKRYQCILRYAYGLAEICCSFLNQTFLKDHRIIKDCYSLYKSLFQTFVVFEKASDHPIVDELMQNLYLFGFSSPEQKLHLHLNLIESHLIKPEQQLETWQESQKYLHFGQLLNYLMSDRFENLSTEALLKYFIFEIFESQPGDSNCSQNIDQDLINSLLDTVSQANDQLSLIREKFKMGSGQILACLTYLKEHVTIQNQKWQELHDDKPYWSQIQLQSQNLLRKLSVEVIQRVSKGFTGSQNLKFQAQLVLLMNIYKELTVGIKSKKNFVQIQVPLDYQDLSILLFAVVQSENEDIVSDFITGTQNMLKFASSTQIKCICDLLSKVQEYLNLSLVNQNLGKVYRKQIKEQGSHYLCLFQHQRILNKISGEVMTIILTLKKIDKLVIDNFIEQQKGKYVRFVKQMLQVFLSKRSENKNTSINLLTQMVSALPLIDCQEIGPQISEVTLQYFSTASDLERSTLIIDLSENLRMQQPKIESDNYWTKTLDMILYLLQGILKKYASEKSSQNSLNAQILNKSFEKLTNLLISGDPDKSLKQIAQENQGEVKLQYRPKLDTQSLSNLIQMFIDFITVNCNNHTLKGASSMLFKTSNSITIAKKFSKIVMYFIQRISEKSSIDLTGPFENIKKNIDSLISFCCMNFVEMEKEPLSKKLITIKENIGQILAEYFLPICQKREQSLFLILSDRASRIVLEMNKSVRLGHIQDVKALLVVENCQQFSLEIVESLLRATKDKSERQELVFDFLSQNRGFEMIIDGITGKMDNQEKDRAKNLAITSNHLSASSKLSSNNNLPGFLSESSTKTKNSQSSPSESENEMDQNEQKQIGIFNSTLLDFVSQKMSLQSYLHKKQNQLIKQEDSLLDQEKEKDLIAATKATGTMKMMRQAATFTKSPTKMLTINKLRSQASKSALVSDIIIQKTLKELVDKNFAISMRLTDCSFGNKEQLNACKNCLWHDRGLGQHAASMTVPYECDTTQIALSFELIEPICISEIQIRFQTNNDQFSVGSNLVPQMATIEGSSSPLPSQKELTNKLAKVEWRSELDSWEEGQARVSVFGKSFFANQDSNSTPLPLTRSVVKYLRFKLFYSQVQGQPMKFKDIKKAHHLLVIGSITVQGSVPQNADHVLQVFRDMSQRYSVNLLNKFISASDSKAIYQQIVNKKSIMQQFDTEFEYLVPQFAKNGIFIEIFTGLCTANEDYCDNIIQNKILQIFAQSPLSQKPNALQAGDPKLIAIFVQILGKLLLLESDRQEMRLQRVLNYLVAQADNLSFGNTSEEDQLAIQFLMKLCFVFVEAASQIARNKAATHNQAKQSNLIDAEDQAENCCFNDGSLALDYSTADIITLIQFGRTLTSNDQWRTLAQLILFLIRPPHQAARQTKSTGNSLIGESGEAKLQTSAFKQQHNRAIELKQIVDSELIPEENLGMEAPSHGDIVFREQDLHLLSLLAHVEPELLDSDQIWARIIELTEAIEIYVDKHMSMRQEESKTEDLQQQVASFSLKSKMVKVPSSMSKKSSDGVSPKISLKKIPKKTNFSEYSSHSLNLTTEQVLHLISILYNFICCPIALESDEFRRDLAHRLYDLTSVTSEILQKFSRQDQNGSVEILPKVFIDAITQCLISLLKRDQILIKQIAKRIIDSLYLLESKTPQNKAQYLQEIDFLQQMHDLIQLQPTVPICLSQITDGNKISPFYEKLRGSQTVDGEHSLIHDVINGQLKQGLIELVKVQKGKLGSNGKLMKDWSAHSSWHELASISCKCDSNKIEDEGQVVAMIEAIKDQQTLMGCLEFTGSDGQQYFMVLFTFANSQMETVDKENSFIVIGLADQSKMSYAILDSSVQNIGNEKCLFKYNSYEKSILFGYFNYNYFCSLQTHSQHCCTFWYNLQTLKNWSSFKGIERLDLKELSLIMTSNSGLPATTKFDRLTFFTWNKNFEQSAVLPSLKDKKKASLDNGEIRQIQSYDKDIFVNSQKETLKESPYFNIYSPYNLLSQNVLLDVPENESIRELLQRISKCREKEKFIVSEGLLVPNLSNSIRLLDAKTKMSELKNHTSEAVLFYDIYAVFSQKILEDQNEQRDLFITDHVQKLVEAKSVTTIIDTTRDKESGNEKNFYPMFRQFQEDQGFDIFIDFALKRVQLTYQSSKIASIWTNFLSMYKKYLCPLPKFNQNFFNTERLKILLDIASGKFDDKEPNSFVLNANLQASTTLSKVKEVKEVSSAKNKKSIKIDQLQFPSSSFGTNNEDPFDAKQFGSNTQPKASSELSISAYSEVDEQQQMQTDPFAQHNDIVPTTLKNKQTRNKKDLTDQDRRQNLQKVKKMEDLCAKLRQEALNLGHQMFLEELKIIQNVSLGKQIVSIGKEQFEFSTACLEHGFFEMIFDQITQISGEQKRKRVTQEHLLSDASDSDQEDLNILDEFGGENGGSPMEPKFPTQDQIDDKKKKDDTKIQKKGVGYSTGVGEIWNIQAYLKDKEKINEQKIYLVNIVKMLAKVVSFAKSLAKQPTSDESEVLAEKDVADNQQRNQFFLSETQLGFTSNLFSCSSLLPMLENALKSGSILEMAKDYQLYMAYLDLIEQMTASEHLNQLLGDLGNAYEPLQRESILTLLKNCSHMAQIFLNCLTGSDEQQQATDEEIEGVNPQMEPKKLSQRIVEVCKSVEQVVVKREEDLQTKDLTQLLSLPLEQAYFELCSKYRLQRFSFVRKPGQKEKSQGKNVKESQGGKYDHHYDDKAKNPTFSKKKLVRLAQEIADLTNSLPIESTNAIYCAVDTQRVDLMKCVIMGAAGTPYAHGAFLFDIYFDDSYPNGPPNIILKTTGGGQIRFNPNLYHCGKVCLSLLGTWRGEATENWNPKVSTLLQVLLSIQAIIMSNEVYFNEPGYEHELNTPQGESANMAYSNIVRYGNMKYAILEQLKNPTPGFEDILRRNFFLKKEVILKEIDEWYELALKHQDDPILNNGLVSSHNSQIFSKFKDDPTFYPKEVKNLRDEIAKEFAKLESPFSDQTPIVSKSPLIEPKVGEKLTNSPQVQTNEQKSETISIKKEQLVQITEDKQVLDDKEVPFDKKYNISQEEHKEIDVDDEKVKDRWSRYIGAMGIEAVAKQAEAVVFVSGLGGLGLEIAKNVVLAGCKELIIHDQVKADKTDLSSQFFITKQYLDQDQNRAILSIDALRELNPYVKITLIGPTLEDVKKILTKRAIDIAVLTDTIRQKFTQEWQVSINELCRQRGTKMIIADQNMLVGRILVDFGPKHAVIDQNGEELADVMLKDIVPVDREDPSKGLYLELLIGGTHSFQEGDIVQLTEVDGMNMKTNQLESVNGKEFKVILVQSRNSFVIDCDFMEYTAYRCNGVAKIVKQRIQISFEPLKEILNESTDKFFDDNLKYMDFEKIQSFSFISKVYKFDQIQTQGIEAKDLEKQDDPEKVKEEITQFSNQFRSLMHLSFGPLCSFLGGIVAQEVIKGITHKFMPIKQEMYYDVLELVRKDSVSQQGTTLNQLFDQKFVEQIENANIFMVGVGAIGCELLKNFAMLGIGTGPEGMITITDPDVIEVSNLNRQFLFREAHLRKPKSLTAAEAILQMNPNLEGHIQARLDKIHKDTLHVYNEQFYKKQSVVTNALDNVAARIFIDNMCVQARVPMVDSGTLGTKGHVQVVIPRLTESYASGKDPEESTQIPLCTLKMFPEETLHCVEWAKDLFGNYFTLAPQNYNKMKNAELTEIEFAQEMKSVRKVLRMCERRPVEFFADCIRMAHCKFYKLFRNDILQLLSVYPLDKVTAEGRPFWSLPKRPPNPLTFDPSNEIHQTFIASYACLLAQIYQIKIPFGEPRSHQSKLEIANAANLLKVKPFEINQAKQSQIESQVQKSIKSDSKESQDLKDELEEEQKQTVMIDTTDKKGSASKDSPYDEDPEILKQRFSECFKEQEKKVDLVVEEFEKDNDSNFHVDFIYACANIRAQNYALSPMDRLTVKLKAGRIVPALATTTAAIAGLQTIEMLKILKQKSLQKKSKNQILQISQKEEEKLDIYRNSFVNLAVPVMQMSEPAPPQKVTLKAGLDVNLWTRWELVINSGDSSTLGKVIRSLENKFKLEARDVLYEATPLFFYALRDPLKPVRKQPIMLKSISECLRETLGSDLLTQNGHIDLTVTFVDTDSQANVDQQIEESKENEDDKQWEIGEKIIENVPLVRLRLA